MLKGDVFKLQYFPVETFAAFVDTFLNKTSGIKNGYLNSMKVTHTTNDVTVASGLACIRGRFFREDSSTTISAVSEGTFFAKLVIEINLSKTNTLDELKQLQYRIVKSESSYPALTQQDIVANETGIYQYELARFKMSSNGISEFKDMRTFLDFDSIYKRIEDEIKKIEAGGIYVTKDELKDFQSAPIGSGMDFFGTTAPEKYMFADGRALSRTEYAELFKVIGTYYGAGDGKTTFNIPDKRKRYTAMYSFGSEHFGELGAVVGSYTHAHGEKTRGTTLSKNQIPKFKGFFDMSGEVARNGAMSGFAGASGICSLGYAESASVANSSVSDSFTTRQDRIDIAFGGDQSHDHPISEDYNIPPTLVCNYIIRVK